MRKPILLLALLGSGTIQSQAGGSAPQAEAPATPEASSQATGLLVGKTYTGDTTYEKIWSLATLYKNESNPILQEFALQGMGQLQWAEMNESGNHYNGEDFNQGATGRERFLGDVAEVRRLRLGIKSKWFNAFKLDGNMDLDPDFSYHAGDPDFIHGFAKQILDLYVTYSRSDAFSLMLGKREVKFGREQEISSKEVITFERSYFANVLYPGELTGVWVNGKGLADHWQYELGLYSNERSDAFTSFGSDNGEIVMAKLGYDYSQAAGLDSAVAAVHFLYSSDPGTKTGNYGAIPKFSTSISLNNDLIQGRFGLTSDLMWADGDVGQSDVFGVSVIPSYFIADGLQVVGRLQYASSDRANGLGLQSRYENFAKLGDNKGDEYMAAYLGINYYLYGHKLKLMTGIEYSSMDGGSKGGDFDGYTALAGLRFSF